MDFVQKGIYFYGELLGDNTSVILPEELMISDRISTEAVLIRLLCGTLRIKYFVEGNNKTIEQQKNYSVPGGVENKIFDTKIIKEFFMLEKYRKAERESIDKYIRHNRRNHFVHEEVLSELTGAIVWMEASPIESFVHIYRALEFISYSFPLIYASKSMDYRGSYEKLKKYMSGERAGELNFFKLFLKELFKNSILFDYEFDIVFVNDNIKFIQAELERVISNKTYYTFEEETFEGGIMKIRFVNMADLLISLRNRYFHMLVGTGEYNFYDIRYDKRELFYAMNPVFINWIAMIYKEIVAYSVGIII